MSATSRSQATLGGPRSEEHTSELQSQSNLVCRLLLEKKKNTSNALPILRTHLGTHNAPFSITPTLSRGTRTNPPSNTILPISSMAENGTTTQYYALTL